jgi:hypothetical protein
MDYISKSAAAALVGVVETPTFVSATKSLLGEEERWALIDDLARKPQDGDLIVDTGGVRKLRRALDGRGKRGGARVIYFYHSRNMPLFLPTAYAKNVKDDLSRADLNAFKLLTKALADTYGK